MAETGAPGNAGRGNLGIGLVLIVLGLVFLAAQLLSADIWANLWPFLIIVVGLAFFVGMVLGGRSAGPLAVPGSIVTTVGLILLYQWTTGHWESWSYAWALIIVAVGVGLMIGGTWSGKQKDVEAGMRTAGIGAVLFVVFGAFFELILKISGGWAIGQVFWPLLLIAMGVYLLWGRAIRRSGQV